MFLFVNNLIFKWLKINKTSLFSKYFNVFFSFLHRTHVNLMILLGFIIMGHPSWKRANIKIFNVCYAQDAEEIRQNMHELINSGRMPITDTNIEIIVRDGNTSIKEIINKRSIDAGLTMVGFDENSFKKDDDISLFEGYDQIGNVLFVHSNGEKVIK